MDREIRTDANPHIERAQNEGIVDDVPNPPYKPVAAERVADLAEFRARRAPMRHTARPGAFLVAARVILIQFAVLAVLAAGFLMLRWGGIL